MPVRLLVMQVAAAQGSGRHLEAGLTDLWCQPHASGLGPLPASYGHTVCGLNRKVAPEATLFAPGSPATNRLGLMVTGHIRRQDGVLAGLTCWHFSQWLESLSSRTHSCFSCPEQQVSQAWGRGFCVLIAGSRAGTEFHILALKNCGKICLQNLPSQPSLRVQFNGILNFIFCHSIFLKKF